MTYLVRKDWKDKHLASLLDNLRLIFRHKSVCVMRVKNNQILNDMFQDYLS